MTYKRPLEGKAKEAKDLKVALDPRTNRAIAMGLLAKLKEREKAFGDNKREFIRDRAVITIYGKGLDPSLAEAPLEIERLKIEIREYMQKINKKVKSIKEGDDTDGKT